MLGNCSKCKRENRIYAKGLCHSCYNILMNKKKITYKATQHCKNLNEFDRGENYDNGRKDFRS